MKVTILYNGIYRTLSIYSLLAMGISFFLLFASHLTMQVRIALILVFHIVKGLMATTDLLKQEGIYAWRMIIIYTSVALKIKVPREALSGGYKSYFY